MGNTCIVVPSFALLGNMNLTKHKANSFTDSLRSGTEAAPFGRADGGSHCEPFTRPGGRAPSRGPGRGRGPPGAAALQVLYCFLSLPVHSEGVRRPP